MLSKHYHNFNYIQVEVIRTSRMKYFYVQKKLKGSLLLPERKDGTGLQISAGYKAFAGCSSLPSVSCRCPCSCLCLLLNILIPEPRHEAPGLLCCLILHQALQHPLYASCCLVHLNQKRLDTFLVQNGLQK